MTFSRKATFSAGGAIAMAIFVGMGCSNDVKTNDGAGGGKTSAASTTNATVSHSATTGSGSTTATSTTGGGTACDQACAKAAGCGFDFCANFMLDCASPVQACAATCINNADCAAIQSIPTQMPNPQLTGCLIGCQQGMGGAGGAGGGTPVSCGMCVQQQGCFPQGCLASAACQAWGQCALACGNQGPSCFTACDAAHADAASFYQQFYSCACSNCGSCGAPMDPCSHLPPNTTASVSAVSSTGSGN